MRRAEAKNDDDMRELQHCTHRALRTDNWNEIVVQFYLIIVLMRLVVFPQAAKGQSGARIERKYPGILGRGRARRSDGLPASEDQQPPGARRGLHRST